MKTIRNYAAALLVPVLLLSAGCVERRTVYVPVYQPAPVAGQPVSLPPGATNPPPPVLVTEAPPPPRQEVVVVSPGPDYVWAPGYWGWNGGWIWVGGGWVVRPHPRAVWVGGGWVRHGGGWGWHGGHWR